MQDKERVVREFFDGQAAEYQNLFLSKTGAGYLFQCRLRLSADILRGSSGALLDCACGTGEVTRAVIVNSNFEFVVANDFSKKMLEQCQKALADVIPADKLRCSSESVFHLPEAWSGERFDVILCLGLIAHTGRLPLVLEVMKKLLKPTGVILLQSSLSDNIGIFVRDLLARTRLKKFSYSIESFDLKSITTAIRNANLEIAEIRRFGLSLPFGDRALGRLNYRLEKRYSLRCRRTGGEALILIKKGRG